VELKQVIDEVNQRIELTSNRTNVELKHAQTKQQQIAAQTSNRTNVELKLYINHSFNVFINFQSNQCGIETQDNHLLMLYLILFQSNQCGIETPLTVSGQQMQRLPIEPMWN